MRFVREQTRQACAPLVPEITLHLADKVTKLWQATEATLDQGDLPPPFWAFAWPGGQALARLVLDRPEIVRGRRVLDFAAGSGLGAIAAGKAGAAKVTASDIDPFALAAILLNAELNGVSVSLEASDVLLDPPAGYELILGGDICYEKPMAERALAWLDQAVAAGAEVLLADPGRAYLPRTGLTELGRYDVPTSLDLENRTMMTTVVYRYRPE